MRHRPVPWYGHDRLSHTRVGDAPTLSAAAHRPRAGAHFSAMHNMPMRYQENTRWLVVTRDGRRLVQGQGAPPRGRAHALPPHLRGVPTMAAPQYLVLIRGKGP